MKRKLLFYYYVTRSALSRFLRRRLVERTEAFVADAYEEAYEKTTNDVFFKTERAWYFGNEIVQPRIGYKKDLLNIFSEKIRSFEVHSVLELGCGRGLNLLALALLCPSLEKIVGIELSEKGVERAKANIANPPLVALTFITGIEKKEILRKLAMSKIEIVQGSARDLPFADRSFETVFSNSVIEQFPVDSSIVFKEAARVSSKIGIFSEPFLEAQRGNIFKILYLGNIDYFKASYKMVRNYGWDILEFKIPPFQKYEFNTGFLTCIKKEGWDSLSQ
ncbi:MAG: hypothetical protein A2928_00105 [Candidatus Taylorbacteria bacterium RIFCSPLOWO2_01_FULL_45_15b]|uniref:Methyltransferase type 11 domain-containing protein n=1 Tax=Candidatus Taylorbacteria bacterium RIFCSPLOWO2_01_FULL_45_15b TaxID=1802319 RepID=A0A1G2N8D3_9BACT|nr:MAG: hypothetical protein A2928_00105 [Candidatus Taylorbacteria bacterium RIFCSPLOWO2_01_FULL_45_15b]